MNPRILTRTIALVLAAPLALHAATFTWDGGGANDNISTPANWNPDGAPPSDLVSTNLHFGGTVRPTPNFSTPFSADSFSFINTAGAFILGGSTITIGASGIANLDAQAQTINNNVTLGTASSSFQATNGALVFNGTLALGTATLFLSGTQATTFGDAITGTGAITKSGSGAFTFSAQNLAIDADFNLNAGGTTLAATGAAQQSFSSASTVAVNGTATLTLDDSVTLDGGRLTRASGAALTIGAGTTLTIQNSADAVITGSFSTGPNSTIVVAGSGSTLQTLSGGSLSISGGTLAIQSGGSVSSASTLNVTGGTLTVDGTGSAVSAAAGGSNWGSNSIATVTFSNAATGNFSGIDMGVTGVALVQVLTGAQVSNSGPLSFSSANLSANGTLTVDGSGSAWIQTGSSDATIGAATNSTATLNLQNGGTFSTGSGVFTVNTTGTVNINGGTFTANGALTNGGAFNFTAGTLNLLGWNNLTIGTGGLLGTGLTLFSTRTLNVVNTTTIDATRTLTMNGGTLRTGALVNNGTLDFQKGTLGITGAAGLNIGTGVLGTNVVLGTGANLEVTNTTTIASGALLRVDGGSFTGSAVTNDGTIDHRNGTLNFTGTLTNNAAGRLFVSGLASPTGTISNAGTITLQNGIGFLGGAGAITNTGLITGDGTIAKPVTNSASGQLRAESGKTLTFTGAVAANAGTMSLQGGTLEFTTAIVNGATGFISGHGALRTTGLTNSGTIAISGGNADIFGDVTNSAGARIVTSGGATTTFFDDVIHNGTEIRTSAGGSSVFFGAVSGAGPYTGTGTVYLEGDLRPGNSPASVLYEGDLVLGGSATLTLELGGLLLGGQYDHLNVGGTFTEDGALDVVLYGGFAPHFGDTFDLFDAGAIAGSFDDVNLPALSGDLDWDTTNLQSTGQLRVVPEPGIGALLAGALALLGARRRGIRGARKCALSET